MCALKRYNRIIPLHSNASPVMYPLRSLLARNSTRFATSSARPNRRKATLLAISVKIFSGTDFVIGVATNPAQFQGVKLLHVLRTASRQIVDDKAHLPGWMQFTRTVGGMIASTPTASLPPPISTEVAYFQENSAISFASALVRPTTPPLLAA
jgi:hypothetical protein